VEGNLTPDLSQYQVKPGKIKGVDGDGKIITNIYKQ